MAARQFRKIANARSSSHGAEPRQLELFGTKLVEQAGPGKEAEDSKECRGMCIGLSGQLIAMPRPGGKQVGNSKLRDDVDGLRDAVAADQIENFAKVLRRRGVH
jgi:hypothetical protein